MIIFKEGNILNSKADYICHQVNCRGAMNSGVAKTIRQEYPEVFTEYFNCNGNGTVHAMYENEFKHWIIDK